MSDKMQLLFDQLALKGLGIGMAVGFIFEVFLIRNHEGSIRWSLSFMSIMAMGMMGWLSYDVAVCSFPQSPWKPTVWAAGITANTWWLCRLIVSGQLARVLGAVLLPEKLQTILRETVKTDRRSK
jgi:hypothetical protein